MGAADPRSLLRVPGRLSYGCTSLATAWPHGGTGLGAVKGIVLRSFSLEYPLTAEEYGGEPIEFLHRATAWGIAAFLRGSDDAARLLLFPNATAGTTTQHAAIAEPGTVRAGMRRSSQAVKLVFTPYDTDRADCVVLYRAIAMLEAAGEVAKMGLPEDYGHPVIFMGIRDSSARTIVQARKEDITL